MSQLSKLVLSYNYLKESFYFACNILETPREWKRPGENSESKKQYSRSPVGYSRLRQLWYGREYSLCKTFYLGAVSFLVKGVRILSGWCNIKDVNSLVREIKCLDIKIASLYNSAACGVDVMNKTNGFVGTRYRRLALHLSANYRQIISSIRSQLFISVDYIFRCNYVSLDRHAIASIALWKNSVFRRRQHDAALTTERPDITILR